MVVGGGGGGAEGGASSILTGFLTRNLSRGFMAFPDWMSPTLDKVHLKRRACNKR